MLRQSYDAFTCLDWGVGRLGLVQELLAASSWGFLLKDLPPWEQPYSPRHCLQLNRNINMSLIYCTLYQTSTIFS